MIRPAVANDVPALVRMAGDFIVAAQPGVPVDPDYLAGSFRAMIAGSDRLVLVLDRDGAACGVLCAAATRSVWASMAVAVELGLWIDPGARGGLSALRLIRAYKSWAKDMGCARASIGALADSPLVRLYARAGFKPAEVIYAAVI